MTHAGPSGPSNRRGRILCVTSNLPRWAGDSTTPFVLHLAQDLAALGWEVDILAPHAPGAARREQLGGIPVERFPYLWPASAQTVCYQGGALVNLRKHPGNRLKLPLLVASELAAVTWRVAARPYDIVHSHWILPQGFTGALATAVRGHPLVITAHGSDLFALGGRLLAALKRFALGRADAVTVNSSFTESAVRTLMPSLGRLARIPMGVNPAPLTPELQARAAALRATHRRGSGPLLLFVGRLVEEKGVGDLLDAMAMLRNHLPDLRALIVGEGQDRAAFEGACRALGLADRVHFTGWVDAADLPAYYAAADCFVGPSRTGPGGIQEAQGLAFAEAMAAGAPVIATRLGGIPDTVIHDQTGLLVPEKSPGDIAEAVRRLHADAGLAQRLRTAAMGHVERHCSRAASARAFDDLFCDLMVPDHGKAR